jgi:hypothetical protein
MNTIRDTYGLDGVSSSVVPVVVVGDDPGARKTVVVHQRAQSSGNLSFLSRSDYSGGVGWVAILRFILMEVR